MDVRQMERPINILGLSDEDASLLHDFLLIDEAMTNKYRKIKMFEPGDRYKYKHQTISFDGNEIFVRTKEKKGSTDYFYTVFSRENFIGEGTYGEVYSASGKLSHIDGKMVYIKEKSDVIKWQTKWHKTAKHECRIAQELPDTKSKKTTSIYRNNKKLYSFNVMAMIPGDDFSSSIWTEGQYTILQSLQLLVSAWTDLKKIDNAGIIQRDIKPGNMIVNHDTMTLRILDFGHGRKKANPDGRLRGTQFYRSPEMITNWKIAGEASDVYSMGIVSRILCKDKTVKADHQVNEESSDDFVKIRENQYKNNELYKVEFDDQFQSQWEKECPSVDIKELANILQGATTSRPGDRWLIDEILSELNLLLPHALTGAVENKQWETILVFLRTRRECVNDSKDYADAYAHALLWAVRDQQTELIDELLEQNAPVNSYFYQGRHVGWTPLHFAIAQDNNELVKKLLKKSANPDGEYKQGKSPLQLAFEKKNPVAIAELLKAEAKPDYVALTKAVNDGEWESVFSFVSSNSEDVTHPESAKTYAYALIQAVRFAGPELIDVLLKKNAPLNFGFEKGKNTGWTALHFAIAEGRNDVVKKLLDAGANPNIEFEEFEEFKDILAVLHDHPLVPLQLAAEKNNHEAIDLLNKHKAKPIVKEQNVLDFLASEEFRDLENYLKHTKVEDNKRVGFFGKQVEKHETLNRFITRLKGCNTMEEIRLVRRLLGVSNTNNENAISDYNILNTQRGFAFRFFQLNTTTIDKVNALSVTMNRRFKT